MYSTRKLLLLLALLLPGALAQAAVVPGFYRVELPVAEGQAPDETLREALEVMLTRLGGADALSQRERFDQALADPGSLMQRIGSADHGGIEVEFEPAQLRELMGAAGQPMLGPTRPGVMLWAAEQSALGDEFMAASGEWAEALNQAARHRAVALSFPLNDLQDRAQVSEQVIVTADQAILVKATERYEATAALALHVTGQSGGWTLDWHLWLDGEALKGSISAQTREQGADELMLRVANQIFSQYAVPAAAAEGLNNWVIVVDDVQGLDAFAGLQRILQQLGSQVAPQLLGINGSQVRLKFDFSGSQAQLERLLALDQRLIKSQAPAPRPVVVAEPSVVFEQPLLEPGITDAPATEVPAAVESSAEPAANILYFRWR